MDAKLELLLWTLISLLCGILVVNAAYRAQGGRLIEMLESSTAGMLVRELALFAFMVGIPFLTLISGASGLDLMALGTDIASPDAVLGFTFANWVRGIGTTAAVVTGTLLVLWLGRRASPRGTAWHISPLAFRDALYNEVHWTFYRAGPALWLNDLYWGTVIGAGLVVLEWLAHPEAHVWFESVEGRQSLAIRLACLLSSSFLYLATQNLWLMMLANVLIQIAGSRVLNAPSVRNERVESRE
jgi:hypothetical protein